MHKHFLSALAVLLSLAAIARAAARVSFLAKRRSLPELVSKIRDTRRESVHDPRFELAVLERLLPILPPYGMGRCVKRSLFLLDLWSRAGLSPSFHIGVRGGEGERSGHAWVTTAAGGIETYRPPDVAEAWQA